MRKCKWIVIISVIICSLCICVYAENITGLQEQSNELAQQLNETNNRLQAVHEEMSKNMQELQELDGQIALSEQEINTINVQINDLINQISENEKKLAEVQKEHDNIQGLLDARLIAMYKAPKLQNLDILLNSKSITEFIGNYYAMKQLNEYDAKLLEKVKQQKLDIETTKKILNHINK